MGNISYAYDCGYKDGAHEGYQLALRDLQPVIDAAKKTLEENLHLCDGDICTLKDLRSAVENLPYSCRKRITTRVTRRRKRRAGG